MKSGFFIFLIVFISSCQKIVLNCDSMNNEKLRLANDIRNKVATQLRKEKELYPIGNCGQMMDQIEILGLSFNYHNPLDIEESRQLLISSLHVFLEAVNNNEKIRPYLIQYPFTPDNIEIEIFLYKPDFSSFGPDKLKVISMVNGILKYDIDNLETKLFSTVYSETYEEALQKIDQIASKKASPEDAVWEDLKIMRLMPNYLVFPAIDPYLPKDFVAREAPLGSEINGIFWGSPEILEDYFKSPKNGPKAPVIKVSLSTNVIQKDGDTFRNEKMFEKELHSQGATNIDLKKWKWRDHPILSCSAVMQDRKLHFAFLGLNHDGLTLLAILMNPKDRNPSSEGERLWSDFLTKTKPLDERDFIKCHGQDLREGLTLVNLNGSILKAYAEKRTRDNQIQVVVQSVDEQLTCNCLSISQGTMGLSWHHNAPLIKVEVELETTEKTKAHILQHMHLSILTKEVEEFSFNQELKSDYLERLGGFSLLNFCKADAIRTEKKTPEKS